MFVLAFVVVGFVIISAWRTQKRLEREKMPLFASGELVFVSHRSWFMFLTGLLLLCPALWMDQQSWFPPPSIPPISLGDTPFLLVLNAILVLPAAYLFKRFLDSRRIEFYGGFVRLFDSLGRNTVDIPYADVSLGELTGGGGPKSPPVYRFRLCVRLSDKVSCFTLTDGRVKGSPYTIWHWLADKAIPEVWMFSKHRYSKLA